MLIEFTLEHHFGNFFHGSHLVSVHRSWGRCGDWNSELGFIDDRGSDASTMFILGTGVLRDTLERINEGVSLLMVTAIKAIA